MTDIQAQVSVPQNAHTVAMALQTMVLAMVNNHKTGGGLAVEAAADVMEALKALSSTVGAFPGLAEEAKSEPIGFAEAFAIAGFGIARSLTGK